MRELIFARERKIKEVLHKKIQEAQQSLKDDIDKVSKLLEQLVKIKMTGTELKQTFDDETENLAGIVGTVESVNGINKVFKTYQEDVLS